MNLLKKISILLLAFLPIQTYALTFPPSIEIPPTTYITDMAEGGLYYPEEKRIELKNNDPWTYAHEVGHHNLWGKDWPDCYSQTGFFRELPHKSAVEDAADSFAYFYFSRKNFRAKADQNKCLMSKYRFIYRLFYPRNTL